MNLTYDQQSAIDEIDNNLQIIACAGSGKTEVISRRIGKILQEKKDVKPENIVAFTFTEKAATSLKNRIQKVVPDIDISNMYVGTIHSFCYKILQENCTSFDKFKILDSVKNFHFLNRYYSKCGMNMTGLTFCDRNAKLFLDCIDKLIYDYDNYELWNENDKKIFKSYKEFLYSKKYFDFSLLIHETLNVLKNNPDILKNIKYLIVDEYQDIDDLQEEIISYFNYNNCNICVVGDDDQTIYRFRGSNSKNMIMFAKRYPKVVQIKLEKNFRCLNSIVDVADNVITKNIDRLEKKMVSGKSPSTQKVKAIDCNSCEEEYSLIAKEIKLLNSYGVEYKDMAILIRKGKYINDITKVLNKNSIPYVSDSAEYFFKNKYFDLIIKTFDIMTRFSKSELYELWKDYCDKEKFNNGFKFLRSAISNSNYANLADLLKKYTESIGFIDECIDIEERLNVLNGMIDILNDFEEIYLDYQLSAKIKNIIDFLNTSAAEQYKYHNFNVDKSDSGVQIMTIHKSKGLEFEVVFLPNVNQGEMPSKNIGGKKYWHILSERFKENKDMFEGDISDERKLMYVAITRAKEHLFMYYDESKPSIFLKEAAQSAYLDIDVTKLSAKEVNKGKEYWDLVKKARDRLYDYYGTAAHFYKAALGDLERIKEMEPDEIIEEAKKLHLI